MDLIDKVENSKLPEELKQKIIGELERLTGLDARKPVAWRLWDEDPVNDKPKWVYYDVTDFTPGLNPADYFFGLEELFKNE